MERKSVYAVILAGLPVQHLVVMLKPVSNVLVAGGRPIWTLGSPTDCDPSRSLLAYKNARYRFQ